MKNPIKLRVFTSGRVKKVPEGWERRLPVEILEDIFALSMMDCHGRIPSGITHRRSTIQPHLRSLAGVCKVWYAMVTPMLYQEVYISSSDALAAFARSVTVHPHLQPLVRSFLYSSIIFKSAAVEHSEADNWNLDRIYRACSNLNRLVVSRSPDLPNDDALVANSLGVEMASLARLTRLEVKLPDGMPCGGRLIFSSSLTLPSLQELILDVLPVEVKPEDIMPSRYGRVEHGMEWPHMPRLTRLCIINWHVKHDCFSLPPQCGQLRVVEILGGNYSSTQSFFDYFPRNTPVLESLTVTASCVAYKQCTAYLRSLSSLTELCIPLRTFKDWWYYYPPDSLQQLVLAGCPEKGFNETSLDVLEKIEERLTTLLKRKISGETLGNLKMVRFVVKSYWSWLPDRDKTFEEEEAIKAAKTAGVKLSFRFRRGRENTFKDNFRQKLLDKYPNLERSL